jgi:Family of unknown function (DUF6496)
VKKLLLDKRLNVNKIEKKKSIAKKVLKKAKKVLKKATKIEKRNKISKVMREFKEDKLHSGSKTGPVVHNPRQAIAIALSEARKIKRKKHKK